MKTNAKKILFIGCGSMGEAILSSCLKNGLYSPENILVAEIDSKKRADIALAYGVRAMSPEEAGRGDNSVGAVIAAIKPREAESIIPLLKNTDFQMLITIMAGVSCSYFTDRLGKIPVLRVMPNMCIKVSKSVSGLFANENLNNSPLKNELMAEAEKIFSASGAVITVKNEDALNRVTAISGSGPAYAAYFVEALENAAAGLGFSADDAALLSLKTVEGTLAYLSETGESALELRKKVTSPGGTTEAAIQVYEENKLKETVSASCRAAYERARALGNKK
ncbi:MAG: pyrroline-5-carboxylate reductase [Elusimicrobia bacterium CG03_land_8_20_14_0_80_50_18]|nr:MAG: pyrroline-5-carboxylate reductase [Elusimicrobia bacterium CG03_land_8_20_14_0_80_50_18]